MLHPRRNDHYVQLCEAIKQKNEIIVRYLIQNKVNVNDLSEMNPTPLNLAVIHFDKSENIITMLLESGANIHGKKHYNYTPLELAIRYNKTEAASLLIRRGALVGEDLNLLLLTAIKQIRDDHTIVKMLIDHGMQYDSSIDLTTSLNAAICEGHLDIMTRIKPHCRFLKPSDQYIPREVVISSDPKYEKCVELLLEWNFTINPNSCQDEDFVFSAVEKGYLPIVLQLLDHGTNVTEINAQGKTLLHFCILLDNDGQDFRYNIAKLLLEKGASIHIQTLGNKLVFEAINNRHQKIAQLFLDYCADIQHITKFQSPDGDTVLHKTINYNFDVKFIKTLLKHNSPVNTVNKKKLTPLLIACKVKSQHQLEIIKALLDYHANVNCADNNLMTPLHFVCQAHNLELISVLLEYGANPNARNDEGHTPLHIICEYKDTMTESIMKLLVKYNANIEAINVKGWTPLFVACNMTNYIAVKYLLNKGANSNATNDEGQTPLHLVCNYESNKTACIIKLLLQHNANIEAVDTKGRTPLFAACEAGNYEAVECLLNSHANADHTDLEKLTPLYVAVQNCKYHPEVVKMLLERKVNIHVIDKWGNSIIHIIVENNNADLIERLTHMPINFNSVNKQGNTPLHIAIGNQSIEVTKELIKYGADVNILGEKNQTPLQNAIENMLYNEDEIKRHCDYFQRWSSRAHSARDDSNDDFNPYVNRVYNYKTIIRILNIQIIKLKTAGLKIHTQNLNIVYNSSGGTTEEFSELNKKCEREIEKMKISIGITGITFYDLLRKNIHFLTRFVRNKKIQSVLKLKVYDNKFPLYIDIIRNRFRDAQFRYRLINSAKIYFGLNINPRLPDDCIDTVFSYLSINELDMFIEANEAIKKLDIPI